MAAAERVQRIIERDEADAGIGDHHQRFIERDVTHAATTLDVVASRMFDENDR